ncbi:LOW QUALITY PROTEIN: Undecaprenyl-diphosphatase [Frankliniella fusca]|uniref:Undecaprenyl-diphosphatase n=1 Tax=Frankliniella fusca TaxID=407009 RepID=A0AAE1H7X7_9NEOP|nr:LOW QUALITY PROTEIN: Undecaprenyl-diphosphatase [Frankliniella fusca]
MEHCLDLDIFHRLINVAKHFNNLWVVHCALLVHGVVLLVQNSVAKSEVVYASRYFKQFNEEIDVLYVHVTFSVHLLTHLENCVINFAQPCLIRLLFSKISMVSEKVLLIAAMV